MYAIFEDGGKQYKVSRGDALLVERQDLEPEQSELTFDRVMMVGDEGETKIGTPWVAGATVKARLVGELKMPKVTGVKFSRRKGYQRKFGHRQQVLRVEITEINA